MDYLATLKTYNMDLVLTGVMVILIYNGTEAMLSLKYKNTRIYNTTCFKYENIGYPTDDNTYVDSVQEQYSELPYPTFDENQIKEEEKYYNLGHNRRPKFVSNPNDFETLNHFIFEGRETFL